MIDTQILTELRKMGNPENVELWRYFGIATPDEFFGVGLPHLKGFAKKIQKDHDKALRLWETKIHDCKLLATMIEEPKRVTEEQINKQIKEIYSPDLADKFCSNVVSKTPFSVIKAELWCISNEEYKKRCGYMLIVDLAKNNNKLKNDFFEHYLELIADKIHGESNWVKEAMNYALIAIGKRNNELFRKALETAKLIGKVKINYGNTPCKHPDAEETLRKLLSKQLLS